MTAARNLEPSAFPETDPLLAAFLNAPVSDEPETEEARAAFEVGMADLREGRVRTVSHQEIQATIERLRHDQGE
jgi:hypothetical protein